MKSWALCTFLVSAAALAACGGSSGGGNGGGGAGGGAAMSSSSSSGSTMTTVSSSGSTSSSSGTMSSSSSSGGTSCDNSGTCQDKTDPTAGCFACAVQGACSDKYQACGTTADCCTVQSNGSCGADSFVGCSNACTQGDTGCLNGCATAHPQGAQIYNDLILCAVCQECPVDCNGPMAGCPAN